MTMQKETLEHDTKVVIYSEKTKELTKEVFMGQAEIPVHLLKQRESSVKISGV